MRLLHSLRGGRDGAVAAEASSYAEAPRAAETEPFAGTQVIGARQERLGADLAEVVQLVGRLQQLSPMVERLQEPLAAEFEAHRRDHSELLSLKVHSNTLGASVKALRETEQALGRQLSDASKANEAAREELDELRRGLHAALAEKGRLQEELARTQDGAEDLRHALAATAASARQLEEDVTALRGRLSQSGDRRRELDALTARARQDADLAEAENTSLRHRVDDLADQLSRLARAEAQAQAEVSSERERAAAVVAEAERVQREASAQAQAFEAQLAAARTQASGLSTRVEAGAARNAKLERLCVELSAKANDAISLRQTLEGAAGDSQTALERAMERIEALERGAAEAKSTQLTLDRARLTALERGDQLAAMVQSQEALLARADGRVRLLEESVQTIAAEEEALRRSHEDETARLTSEVRRLETDVHISQAALKAAREHRSFAPVA